MMWWRMWKGHVFTVVALALIATTLVCLGLVLLTEDVDVAFWSYVVGMIVFLLGVVLGIIASHTTKTKAERLYMRQEAARPLTGLEPPGRDGTAGGSRITHLRKTPVSEAYRRDEEAHRER